MYKPNRTTFPDLSGNHCYYPSLAAACVCPIVRPKRPTTKRTKKNTKTLVTIYAGGVG